MTTGRINQVTTNRAVPVLKKEQRPPHMPILTCEKAFLQPFHISARPGVRHLLEDIKSRNLLETFRSDSPLALVRNYQLLWRNPNYLESTTFFSRSHKSRALLSMSEGHRSRPFVRTTHNRLPKRKQHNRGGSSSG